MIDFFYFILFKSNTPEGYKTLIALLSAARKTKRKQANK